MLLLCGVFLSSCCSPAPLQVTVTFNGADSRLGLENYKYHVNFNDTTKISIDIPKGYDYTVASAYVISASGDEKIDIEYTVKYLDDIVPEEGYEYDYEKTITFELNFIKRDFEIVIDLSEMQKLKFDITLGSDMSEFQALIIPKEKTQGLITELNDSDLLEKIDFEDYKASIEYGNYVILNHDKVTSNANYSSIYSDINHYTLDKDKANIGTINYSYYNKAQKGNTDYLFNNDYRTSLYYIGEIKEDINFYSSVPNYIQDKGFQIDRSPNMFYMFTNLTEYNGDMLTIEAYAPTDKTYSASNANMDKIDGKTVEKVNPSSIYNNRYDVYKIYLGNNLQTDVLLTDEDRKDANEELYFVVSSCIGLENINFHMLENEFERTTTAHHIDVQTSLTAKGKNYIKFEKDDLSKFILQRDKIMPSGTVVDYQTGLSILYPEVDYTFFGNTKFTSHLRIFKNIEIISKDAKIDEEDISFNLSFLDGEDVKYGLHDNHFWPNNSSKTDCEYFQVSDLFDYVLEKDKWVYRYKNNLYLSIKSNEYENFKSPLLDGFTLYVEDLPQTRTPIKVIDAKTYNGYNDYLITNFSYDFMGEYSLTIKVSLRGTYTNSTVLDFSYFDMPENYTQGIYMTSNSLFEKVEDFTFISGSNKDTFNKLKFGMVGDLYYFVRSDEDFDIEVRLDPDDPATKISASGYYKDIKGEKITMKVQGLPYNIKVIKQDTIYELLDGKMYVVRV